MVGINIKADAVPLKRTCYVIVHPDDFAFSLSKKISDIDNFKKKLLQKISDLYNQGVKIIVLNLNEGMELPDFFYGYENMIYLIPNFHQQNVSQQVLALKKLLFLQLKTMKKIIMAGGWEYACFKHTLNNLIAQEHRIKIISKVREPFETIITYHRLSKKFIIEIDYEFVF